MIWRWLICFNRLLKKRRAANDGRESLSRSFRGIGLLACLSLFQQPVYVLGVWLAVPRLVPAATVSGRVAITDSRDTAVQKRHDYGGVVLWLEPIGHPAPSTDDPKRAQMIQKEKRFQPHVLAIEVGGTVDFPNLDPIFHNAFSNFSGQPFDVSLYPPGTTRSVTFTRPGIVRVFCNIHSTMSAIICVLSTPWFAVTPQSGAFRIAGVPPGDYQLRVFQEHALPEHLKSIERRISVGEGDLELPPISISEAGYIPAPHLNKYGLEYPPLPVDGAYPGAPR